MGIWATEMQQSIKTIRLTKVILCSDNLLELWLIIEVSNPSLALQIPDNYNRYYCYKDGGKDDIVLYNIWCCFFIDFVDQFLYFNVFIFIPLYTEWDVTHD